MSREKSIVSTYEVDVEWGDCDPAQIVFYPNYFAWFDQATWRLFAKVGITRAVLNRTYDAIGYPLVKADVEFVRSARPGDRLTIESRIERWGRSSFSVLHHVRNPDGQAGAVGHETRVWARRKAGTMDQLEAVAIPEEVIALFGGSR